MILLILSLFIYNILNLLSLTVKNCGRSKIVQHVTNKHHAAHQTNITVRESTLQDFKMFFHTADVIFDSDTIRGVTTVCEALHCAES